MRESFYIFLQAEDGATTIEYAAIASLISVAIFASAVAIGDSVFGLFTKAVLGFK